jgi:hypothetical protein
MASASQFPFQPLGKSHLLVAASPAPAPIQVNVDKTTTGSGQYRVVNVNHLGV